MAMGYFLGEIDYEKHNEEAREVWEAFHARKPIRVPVVISANSRILLLNPEMNPEGITYEDYWAEPDLMASVQMRTQHYIRHSILSDAEMGLPKDGWGLGVDTQNCYEAMWFGAQAHQRAGQVPVTRTLLNDDNKRMLFDKGFPEPTGDWAWRTYEHLESNKGDYEYAGVKVSGVGPPGIGTDGPMTVAANLRGATELCLEFYEDPDYVRELLRYITEATIHRIKALREQLGQEMKPKAWGFADDSIELLTVDMYKEFVLPYHKLLLGELTGEGPHFVHLCGDVDRLMPVLKEELNVNTWDAGFPIDYGGMRKTLGPDFQIQTGPRISLLLHGTPQEVEAETKRILETGITDGGRFVMHEANNLAPRTPVENVAAMYEATRKYGRHG